MLSGETQRRALPLYEREMNDSSTYLLLNLDSVLMMLSTCDVNNIQTPICSFSIEILPILDALIRRKVGKGSVLMEIKCLNTTFPGFFCLMMKKI